MGNLIGGKDDKMSYKFKITRGNAILNFSEEYCQSRCELIESESFARVLKGYVHDIKRKKTTAYEYLREVQKESIDIVDDLRTVFRLLLVMDPKELASIYPKFAPYFRDMDEFTQVIEDIYLFWRRLQRYSVVYNEESRGGYQNVQFADAQANFEALVLSVYRSIKNKCIGQSENVLRQITAGVNAGLRVSNMRSFLPYEYRCLDNIPFIESVIIHPPFITYSKRNKRDGVFPETKKNPIEDLKFDQDQWFCYPAKVGDLLCFVYFNVAYMAQGVTLCNLFQLATEEEYRNRKPDMIYVYGYEDGKKHQYFYQDDENDMMVALLSANDEFDYFGYMKKMMLTFPNNPGMISGSRLFVHPIFVNITYCGIITTANGIIIVARSPKKIPFFPLNFNLLKENAAREEVNAPTTNTGIATVKVFLKPLKNSGFCNTSEYFPNFQGSGIILKFAERIWFFVIKELNTMYKSGNTIATAPIKSSKNIMPSIVFAFFVFTSELCSSNFAIFPPPYSIVLTHLS